MSELGVYVRELPGKKLFVRRGGSGVLVATTKAEVATWLATDLVILAATKEKLHGPKECPAWTPSVSLLPRFGRFRSTAGRADVEQGWNVLVAT